MRTTRIPGRWWTVLAMAGILPAAALGRPGAVEPPGAWTFQTERPVKAVLVGGSVAAFTGKGFADQLQGACRNLEVRNLAEARLSAAAIRQRFQRQVLDNPALEKGWGGAGPGWVLVLGGLNSVGNPEQTNAEVLELYRAARKAGLKVLGLTLNPWGDEGDRRWAGFEGVRRQDNTRRAVDFVMGRLGPQEALGRYANGQTRWQPGDLPDIAVDLYDSDLRDRNAPLRDPGPLRAALDTHPVAPARLTDVPPEQRAEARDRLLRQAVEIPRWYLRADLRSFDHIHPNREGHRLIALAICRKAPAEWGCDCKALENPPLGGGR